MQFRGKIENVFVYQSSADLGGDIRMFYADQLKYLIDGKFVAFYNLVPEASATDRVAIAGAELDNAQITAGVKRMMEY